MNFYPPAIQFWAPLPPLALTPENSQRILEKFVFYPFVPKKEKKKNFFPTTILPSTASICAVNIIFPILFYKGQLHLIHHCFKRNFKNYIEIQNNKNRNHRKQYIEKDKPECHNLNIVLLFVNLK